MIFKAKDLRPISFIGGPASNKLASGVQELVLELVRQNYRDFGPPLAADALLERHGIEVSRATLRRWLVEVGVWLSRKQRRSFHQPRRRESQGELVKSDSTNGSHCLQPDLKTCITLLTSRQIG